MKIVLSVAVVTALLLVGCSDESEKSQPKKVIEKTPVVEKIVEVEVVEVEKVAVEKDAKTETTAIVDEVITVVSDANDEVVAVVSDITDVVSDVSGGAVAVVKDVVSDASGGAVTVVKDVISAVTPKSSVDGKAAYSSCAGCHGTNGEKKALGKSKVITGWDVAKTADALNGYAAGTYGGAMKGIMKGQAAKLSADEITAVSDYISKL